MWDLRASEQPGLATEKGRSGHVLEVALDLLRLSRAYTWMVSIVPYYVGYQLATRDLFPGWDDWSSFWRGVAAGEFAGGASLLRSLVGDLLPFLAGVLAVGPLMWAATLYINDLYDVDTDRGNPRKADSPLLQGRISLSFLRRAAYTCGFLAVVLAATVNLSLAVIVLAILFMSLVYSLPPLRLKTRPPLDVVTSSVTLGGLVVLAGWATARPISAFPWTIALPGVAAAAALYIPTTIVDFESDRAGGDATIATRFGIRQAYRIAFGAWLCANGLAFAFALTGRLPVPMLPWLAALGPALLIEYHLGIGRARSEADMVRGIGVVSMTFLVAVLVLALTLRGEAL